MPRELIVVTKHIAGVGLSSQGLSSDTGADLAGLVSVLEAKGASLQPLFVPHVVDPLVAMPLEDLPEPSAPPALPSGMELQPEAPSLRDGLATFFRVEVEDGHIETLADELSQLDVVEVAYIKPEAEPAIAPLLQSDTLSDVPIQSLSAVVATPNLTARQQYMRKAPDGIDSDYARSLPGGAGTGIRVVDIEGGWNLTHEKFKQNKGGLIFGKMVGTTPDDQKAWRNHGTAVLGVLGADFANSGVIGICPDAWIACASHSSGSASAIYHAADKLRPGDVLLLEMHRPGPAANYQNNDAQAGYIAVEWWPDDLAAIRYAVGRGVIVVEAAGNGAQPLDDAIYDQRPPSFPSSWKNPFNASNPGSGAVVVGAGAPPRGTHGHDIHGPARSRLPFSNYGSRVDCQGWGREVTTTGYGDLQGTKEGVNENRFYTDIFSGTSSASPIVAGVIACVNSFLRARGTTGPLTPRLAQLWLRATGSPQQDHVERSSSERIGSLPDLRAILTKI